MYNPRTLVVFWYRDKYNRKWEHIVKWQDFKHTAINLLENNIDNYNDIYYTINENTYKLDYYNSEL